MLKVNSYVVPSAGQWEIAIKGMRNPMNSWDRSNSDGSVLGDSDKELMLKLIRAGVEHRKFLRMLPVTVDITAPLYWWKEADTYKVGTTENSTSTMHKITAKEFEVSDFSFEHCLDDALMFGTLTSVIRVLNTAREHYLKTKDKRYWWDIIQLLPSSYNQTRTVFLNYEVLGNIYRQRNGHKLDEWQTFRSWIEDLPNAFLITEGVS